MQNACKMIILMLLFQLTYPLALLILYDVLYGNDTTIKGPLTRTISRYHIALKHIYKQVQAQPVSSKSSNDFTCPLKHYIFYKRQCTSTSLCSC